MNKKVITIVILIFLMIFTINTNNIYAANLSDVISGGKDFLESSKDNVKIDEDKLIKTSSSIYNILLMVSFVVVAVVGISLGIKYMMAGVEEKADVKNSLIVFVIGCIVVYGSFGIWKVIVSFLNTL